MDYEFDNNKDAYDNGWRDGYEVAEEELQPKIEALREENSRLRAELMPGLPQHNGVKMTLNEFKDSIELPIGYSEVVATIIAHLDADEPLAQAAVGFTKTWEYLNKCSIEEIGLNILILEVMEAREKLFNSIDAAGLVSWLFTDIPSLEEERVLRRRYPTQQLRMNLDKYAHGFSQELESHYSKPVGQLTYYDVLFHMSLGLRVW